MDFAVFGYYQWSKFSAEGTLRISSDSQSSCLPVQRASTESLKYHPPPVQFEFGSIYRIDRRTLSRTTETNDHHH